MRKENIKVGGLYKVGSAKVRVVAEPRKRTYANSYYVRAHLDGDPAAERSYAPRDFECEWTEREEAEYQERLAARKRDSDRTTEVEAIFARVGVLALVSVRRGALRISVSGAEADRLVELVFRLGAEEVLS